MKTLRTSRFNGIKIMKKKIPHKSMYFKKLFPIPALFLSVLLCLIFIFHGCSSGSKLPPNINMSDLEPFKNDNLETVVIMGINDFHGALSARSYNTKDGIEFQMGGADMLAGHIQNLRKEFGSRFLLLDAGDQWQGTIDSNSVEGASVVDFFNTIEVDAATIGNHEFDFGPVGEEGIKGDIRGNLKARLKQAKYPYVAANIWDKKTGELISLPNTSPHILLKAGGLKIGIIGLTTESTSTTTRTEYVKDLNFSRLNESTQTQAKELREKGAHIVLLLAHVGLECPSDYQYKVHTKKDQKRNCNPKEELVQLINKLPQGTIDGVVSGHSHQIIHHWVKDIPVIQAGASGLYYNLLYLTYNWDQKKLVTNFSRIEGPVPVCKKIFKNLQHCNGKGTDSEEKRGALVTPVFHNKKIIADKKVTRLLKDSFEKTKEIKQKIVGVAARKIKHHREKESELANLVADALREKTNADFALVNPGGLRAPIDSGPITYEELFTTLPFDNAVSVLTVSGIELKNILKVANCGARGFFGTSGLKVKVIDLPYRAPARDLNGDGKISHWEVNRLLSVRTANGKRIKNFKHYTLATIDFLVNGGDDLGWPMSKIPQKRKVLNAAGFMRDVVAEYLNEKSPINTPKNPLVKKSRPRLILQKRYE